MKLIKDKYLIFGMIPNTGCNFDCSYCFLTHQEKNTSKSMYDNIPVEKWVEAMNNWKDYEVEFYLWASGEVFIKPQAFDLVKRWSDYDFVKYARIDTNGWAYKDIAEKCDNSKVKLNLSWHTERITWDRLKESIKKLGPKHMIGMINFVASDVNMEYLRMNGIKLYDVIEFCEKRNIFFNVAGDFNKGLDPEYKKFILKYQTEKDYEYIHNLHRPTGKKCLSGRNFFWIDYSGDIYRCNDDKVVGNFFTGKLDIENDVECRKPNCTAILRYGLQQDNEFGAYRHLEDYAKRNREWRNK